MEGEFGTQEQSGQYVEQGITEFLQHFHVHQQIQRIEFRQFVSATHPLEILIPVNSEKPAFTCSHLSERYYQKV